MFATSNTVTGEGFLPFSSLDATGLNAPNDGVIVWRFDIIIGIVSFDPAKVWNAETAFSDQLRGGRVILYGREGLGEEYFIGRPQTRIRNCWYYDADFDETTAGRVGTGKRLIRLSQEVLGARYCERIYYGFEPGVQAQIRVAGDYMILDNPGDLNAYDLERN